MTRPDQRARFRLFLSQGITGSPQPIDLRPLTALLAIAAAVVFAMLRA